MTKTIKTAAHEEPATANALVVLPTEPAIEEIDGVWDDEAEAQAEAETEEQINKQGTVVKAHYKRRYRDRAREAGIRGKAAKRSNWDWLAQTLAAIVLDRHHKLNVDALVALLQANGEPDPLGRWDNRSKGWEGRLRMTGGLWLRTVVAEEGVLYTADGEELIPPPEWVAKILR